MRWLVILLFAGLLLFHFSCGSPDNGDRPEVGITLDSLVRRVAIPSQQMGKVFNANVILPESYFLDTTPRFYPVVYLLHGYSGNFSNWHEKVPSLRKLASQHQLILVCPEGNFSSWYLDSSLDSGMLFFTYISQEVPSYIDAHFRTYDDARYRGITGLSMGGHGALLIALAHPDWFGAAGSMSGVVDLRTHPNDYDIAKHLGSYEADTLLWAANSVVEIASQRRRSNPKLIIDCGTSDSLIIDNRRLHEVLLENTIPHTYTERPGNHDWLYWEEAINYQLLFFDRFFKEG